jgi:probable F420-dependent oxidoreductase
VKYGLTIFPTDEGPKPAELARRVEDAGFESLFNTDHTHTPASRDSDAPRGGELPREYLHNLDPFVSLTAAASATESLRVATGICLVVERDPITTAKSVATLDYISGGRFLFGIGGGWNKEEMRNHGTDPKRRFSVMAERVQAMKAIWTEEEASFHGEFVDFNRIWAWPKPVQKPHPPVMVGGNGRKVIDRVLAFGDEWLPEPQDGLVDRIAELQQRAGEADRGSIPVTVYGADPEDVGAYAEAGVQRCVFWLPPRDDKKIRSRIAELASAFRLG